MINDDRHLNAIACATEGDEPECEEELRITREVKTVNDMVRERLERQAHPDSIMGGMEAIRKLSDQILGEGK